MIPSGITPVDAQELTIKKVGVGLYTVVNAYEGEYRFFSTDPLMTTVSSTSDRDTSADASAETASDTGAAS